MLPKPVFLQASQTPECNTIKSKHSHPVREKSTLPVRNNNRHHHHNHQNGQQPSPYRSWSYNGRGRGDHHHQQSRFHSAKKGDGSFDKRHSRPMKFDILDRIKNYEFCSKNDNIQLNTPEEIAKWRAERRARFPTVESVQIKAQLAEEVKKSELESVPITSVPLRDNRNHRQSWQDKGSRGRGHWKGNNHGYRQPKRNSSYHRDHNTMFGIKRSRLEEKEILSVNSTIPHLPDNNSLPQEIDSVSPTNSLPPLTSNNSLSLISYYASDQESDSDPVEAPNTLVPHDQQQQQKTDQNNQLLQVKEKEIEVAATQVIHHLVSQVERNIQFVKEKHRTKPKRSPYIPQLTYNKLTLFQKLMLQDVRKVSVELLQCMQLLVNTDLSQHHSQGN